MTTAGVPILMYHAVAAAPAKAARGLSVAPAAFAEQMELLADRGFTPLTTRQLAAVWRDGRRALPARPVLITFDDGYEGVHRHALPELLRHGFPATLFTSTGWMRGRGAEDHAPGAPDTTLDWDQVRELAASGVEIGGHSHSHPQLDQLSDERLWFEVLRCKEILAEELDSPPISFAYPYGYSSQRVRRTVRTAGFGISLAVGNRLAARAQGPYALRRVTVRRSTSIAEFERLVEGRAVARSFAKDRALTKSYAMVRRTRRALGKVRGARV
ncbi:polysaccharide deacetylase family protein [Streptantibioticus ferralitis]|uniref:Polysaccharide deacetylase family protein n=1 Tax=Streptantibioticus ferralitis TaxID=236510 RepID=A0ABT5YXZ0_9ACTN|nr:polysaccharide deacetylase family protein [Streptantibioticus ferralitis]MDF2256466.1 polysaccharide deacetylase family protein [Streptantibioticus ferralitis]